MRTSSLPRRSAGVATALVFAVGLVAGSTGVARGQTVPDPSVPPVAPPSSPEWPDEARPAVDVVSPAAQGMLGPSCSSLAGALALGLVVAAAGGGDAAATLNPIYQAVQTTQVAACGALPPSSTRTTCGPDAEVGDGVTAAAGPGGEAGAPVNPVEVAPKPRAVGGAVESVRAAEHLADANGVPAPGAGDEAASALGCETVVVGGEFVPHQFDPTDRSITASGMTPSDAVGGPASGPAVAPVAQDDGGIHPATGATVRDDGGPAEPARSEAAAAGGADGEFAAAQASSSPTGKIAILVALALLTALSFIPSRTPARRT